MKTKEKKPKAHMWGAYYDNVFGGTIRECTRANCTAFQEKDSKDIEYSGSRASCIGCREGLAEGRPLRPETQYKIALEAIVTKAAGSNDPLILELAELARSTLMECRAA